MDALIAAIASRTGALLVTVNSADFERLSVAMPLNVEAFEAFKRRLST